MAERLKGLLDSAREKIGGLLGDFPAGFNSGAVAGVAGYPGDIAYMLDTAGRALTGQHTQPAAQDFPGTTEYLAKQAGYPIPQSFSGQLGAAVGGILTPGPGDLAKFAPVLSAIPFWHGSPHKYDAVDLSKIGTGEGAQAYGWGYYGAESKGVAQEYKNALSNTLESTVDAPNLERRAAQMALTFGDNTTEGAIKWLDKYKGKGAAHTAPALTPEVIDSVQQRFMRGEFFPGGNLYKGEYRWPDPAKEAATPLTEADLLDWDKPLSEQSPQVRKAINDYMTLRGVDSYKTDDGSSVYLGVGAESALTGKDVYRDMWQASRNAAIDSGRNADTTFDAAQRAASEDLNFVGIPGIRYLDQMSRGGEGGTYNYVMFQDKGIKLLERNGEPIPAAAEFAARREGKPKPYKEFDLGEWAKGTRVSSQDGEPVVMYHGTTHDIEEFKPGTFFTANPQRASGYTETKSGKTDGGTVYPTLINMRNPIKVYGQETSQIPGAGFIVGDELAAKYANNITAADFAYDENLMRIAKEKGYDGVLVMDDYRTNNPVTAIPFESSQVRFAAGYGQKRRGK